jgi:hypothetical protein
MENPINHTIDLGFVNYVQHPENKHYVVFRFVDENRAKSFEEELKSSKIWHEKDTQERKQKTHYLFAIHQTDFKKAEKINYRVEGKHKKPIIPFKGFRWFLYIFGAIVLSITLMGYCSAQDKLKEHDRLLNSQQ